MPLVLESTSYEVGYAIGQVIGYGLFIAIPVGIIYAIVRARKSSKAKAATMPGASRQPDFALPPDVPSLMRCPDCSTESPRGRRFCMNCGRQFGEPAP